MLLEAAVPGALQEGFTAGKIKNMFRYSLLCIALLGWASQAHAQAKAETMFDEPYRDFGSVPRGQILLHAFRVVNNTQQPAHITSVRVSCGCTSARALQSYLQPGQETVILAQMDTNRFINTKTVTIFVTFDQPRFEEVRLWVQANSRDDVMFSPDNIAFGRVQRGSTPESKISVAFLGGVPTQIVDLKSESNYVLPSFQAVRQPTGNMGYEIIAKLRKDTPAGKWYTDLWLTTNNPAMPRLRVPVTVEVESALSASPNTVSLGAVKAGTDTDRKVIIRGIQPFRIIGITGTDNQLQVRTTNSESKTVHVLTVTLNPREPGPLSRKIIVQTDLKTGNQIEFNAQAEVTP
jgi:hypothetical protein